jgi:glyoxalase family protein
MKNKLICGLHHVTALADSAGKNIDFYSGILGLRLIKKTINFDDPGVYHLYYGNESGSPGTIMTFFPYSGMRKGRHGNGQMTATSFSVPEKSLAYWIKRLEQFNVDISKPQKRFDEMYISFEDVHGLGLELVFNSTDQRPGFTYGNIPLECAVKGFHGVTLLEENHEPTGRMLTEHLDHTMVAHHGNVYRYASGDKSGEYVNIIHAPGSIRGISGSGTIHHVAFATTDDATQSEAREKLLSAGVNPTPVIDRQYFHSIYFREPGGILFEIATIPPGFTVDEDIARLGEELKLPSWLEASRDQIEDQLEPLRIPADQFMDR